MTVQHDSQELQGSKEDHPGDIISTAGCFPLITKLVKAGSSSRSYNAQTPRDGVSAHARKSSAIVIAESSITIDAQIVHQDKKPRQDECAIPLDC